MGTERPARSNLRERSFAELFPWRNMRRVVMLLALIVAIVVIKRSMQPLLDQASRLWGPSAPASHARWSSSPPGSSRLHVEPRPMPPPASAPAADPR